MNMNKPPIFQGPSTGPQLTGSDQGAIDWYRQHAPEFCEGLSDKALAGILYNLDCSIYEMHERAEKVLRQHCYNPAG